MRVMVTGGTGVIGAWAVRELADAGHDVIVATRGSSNVGRPIFAGRACEDVGVDLTDAVAVRDAIHAYRPDAIAHLASAKPWQMDAGYVDDPDPTLGVSVIVNGTTNILEAARREGVSRVVYASSKSAYAPFRGEYSFPEYRPVPETYAKEPTEIYGITKLASEQLGAYYRQHLGVDFIALRFGSTYGPFKRGAGTSPAGLIASAIAGAPVHAEYSRRTYIEERDEFVYNRDIGRAIRLACEAPPTTDAVFNIGTGWPHRSPMSSMRSDPSRACPRSTSSCPTKSDQGRAGTSSLTPRASWIRAGRGSSSVSSRSSTFVPGSRMPPQ